MFLAKALFLSLQLGISTVSNFDSLAEDSKHFHFTSVLLDINVPSAYMFFMAKALILGVFPYISLLLSVKIIRVYSSESVYRLPSARYNGL